MYKKYIKRILDFTLSLIALIVLSPVLLVLTVLGAVKMKGNPFFTQLRVGKDEKLFRLVKFRSMTCEKDKEGNLLPDDQRLTRYGRLLRSTSLDELPQLINILKGDMAIVGPRPLLEENLPYYTEEEKHRHDVRPGLTGLAQVSGRNAIEWDQKLAYDVMYIKDITFIKDMMIMIRTVVKVFKRSDIRVGSELQSLDFVTQRKLRMARDQEQNETEA